MRRQVMQPFRAPRKTTSAQQNTALAQNDTTDSEEQTEMGLVWPTIITETQYSDVEDIIEKDKNDTNGNTTKFTIEARVERSPERNGKQQDISSKVASPACSEFEAFLEKASDLAVHRTKQSKTDAYWENVLQCEKERLANQNNTRMISVEDIMLAESSEDDDVPIAATLQGKKDNLSLLVNAATASISSPSNAIHRSNAGCQKGYYVRPSKK